MIEEGSDMWTEEKIADAFGQIMKEVTEAEFDKEPVLRKEKLLGEKIDLKARDLVVLLHRTEDVLMYLSRMISYVTGILIHMTIYWGCCFSYW